LAKSLKWTRRTTVKLGVVFLKQSKHQNLDAPPLAMLWTDIKPPPWFTLSLCWWNPSNKITLSNLWQECHHGTKSLTNSMEQGPSWEY
jgi:hypothetical protein